MSTRSTTPTTAARTSPTSPSSPLSSLRAPAPAPARRRPAGSGSTSPPAATTPRSAASPPVRCPRQHHGSRRRASSSTTGCWSRTASCARPRRGTADQAGFPSRDPDDQPRRPARPDRREREGRRGAASHGRAVRPQRRPRLHGPCPGERRGSGQDVITALRDGDCELRDSTTARNQGRGNVDQTAAPPPSTSPARQPAARRQLQRTVKRGDGRRALRLPHPGSQGHPAERRLPQAAHRDHPAGDDAVTRSTPPRSPQATSRPVRRSPARSTPRSGSWPRARAR